MDELSAINVFSMADTGHENLAIHPVEDYAVRAGAKPPNGAWDALQPFNVPKGIAAGQVGFYLLDDSPLVNRWNFFQFSVGLACKSIDDHNPRRLSICLLETLPERRDRSMEAMKSGEADSISSRSSSMASASRNNPTERDFLSTKRTIPFRYFEGWDKNASNGTTSSLNNMALFISLILTGISPSDNTRGLTMLIQSRNPGSLFRLSRALRQAQDSPSGEGGNLDSLKDSSRRPRYENP